MQKFYNTTYIANNYYCVAMQMLKNYVRMYACSFAVRMSTGN